MTTTLSSRGEAFYQSILDQLKRLNETEVTAVYQKIVTEHLRKIDDQLEDLLCEIENSNDGSPEERAQ